MTSSSLSAKNHMLRISNLPCAGQLSLLESITTLESQLQQKLSRDATGPKSTKRCRLCGVDKPYSEFHKKRSDLDRHDSRCKECKRVYRSALTQVKIDAPSKPDTCQCCGKETTKLVVDHCHQSNAFRGWICGECNTSIGKLGDNLAGILKAALYLSLNTNATQEQI